MQCVTSLKVGSFVAVAVPRHLPYASSTACSMTSGGRWLDAALATAKQGLLGTLFVMSKDVGRPNSLVAALSLIQCAQVLHFPLSDHPSFPWVKGGHTGILTVIRALKVSLVQSLFGDSEVGDVSACSGCFLFG